MVRGQPPFLCLFLRLLGLLLLLKLQLYGIMITGGDTVSTSESVKKAIAKYQEKLDDIKVRVPKGQRERYKAYASRRGMSLNALIIQLLEDDMKLHDE